MLVCESVWDVFQLYTKAVLVSVAITLACESVWAVFQLYKKAVLVNVAITLACESVWDVFQLYKKVVLVNVAITLLCLVADKKGSDTVYSNSAKQFLILGPPAVLTLHLKRFEQVKWQQSG